MQPAPQQASDGSIFAVFARIAAAEPDKIAVDDGGASLTYREVHERALAVAHRLLNTLPAGALVGIAVPNGVLYPVAMLGCLAAGLPFVPLDVTSPEARNALICRHSGMNAAIVSAKTAAAMRRTCEDLVQIDIDELPSVPPFALPQLPPEHPAAIVYTSGSEGRPKGVCHKRETFFHWVELRTRRLGTSGSDRFIHLLAPSTITALGAAFLSLMSRGTLFIVDLKTRGLDDVIDVLRRERITVYHSVPYLFRKLLRVNRDPETFGTIRAVYLTGDWIFASDVELLRAHFPPDCILSIGVGTSETFRYAERIIDRTTPMTEPRPAVGHVQPGYEVTFVDDDGGTVPAGEGGEIVVHGRYVGLGYWNDAEATRRAFSVSPADPGVRSYRTGDLGRVRPDGMLELFGRKGRMIKINGNRVEPAEVEAALRTHPAIRDAAVVPRGGDTVVLSAYVVRDEDAALSAGELKDWLRSRLMDAMQPREIRFVAEIPTLENFKYDIRTLRETDREEAHARPEPASASASSVERAVRAAWLRVLGRPTFEANLSLDETGCDSLDVLELIFELQATLGRTVPRDSVDPTMRPSDLVARLLAIDGQGHDGPFGSEPPAQLFLFPGVNRPDIHYMRLAQLLGERVFVRMLDYPSIDPEHLAGVRVEAVFAEAVAHSVAQICERAAPGEALRLVGYSFGAFVAFEAAHRLRGKGFEIAFLGSIDTAPAMLDDLPVYLRGDSVLARLWRTVTSGLLLRQSLARAWRVVCERQMERRSFALVAWEWRLLNRLRLRRAAIILREVAGQYVRTCSLRSQEFAYHALALHLFLADGNPKWGGALADFGWAKLCRDTTVTPIAGDHQSVFFPANVKTAAGAILAALPKPSHADRETESLVPNL